MNVELTIAPLFDQVKGATPHILLELSHRLMQRLLSNSIHLSNMYVDNNKIYYNDIEVGKNVITKKSHIGRGINVSGDLSELKLQEIKGNYFIITINKSELFKFKELMHVIPLHYGMTNENNSGRLMIMMAVLKVKQSNTALLWSNKHYDAVRRCKKNVMTKKNSHHGSNGEYFSFGNKAEYKLVNNSSIGQYVMKPRINDSTKLGGIAIEELMNRELMEGIKLLGTIVPSISEYIAPIFKVANDLQCTKGDINIKASTGSEHGIWKSVFCVNAVTEELHNEDDCSYTVVTVPKQCSMQSKRYYNFLLQVNDSKSIFFQINEPISYLWSGKFLVHRQFCNAANFNGMDNFFNLQTYTNKKIFNHVKKSFQRVKINK